MNQELTFAKRLVKVIVPTRVQTLGCVFLSMCALVFFESTSVLNRIGVNATALQASQGQLRERFSGITNSLLASNVALVAFWSVVGLIAYLLCWAGYNLLIEARNEVTLQTQYENRGRNHGPWKTLLIKAVVGAGLFAVIVTFRYGVALSLALVAPVIDQVLVGTVLAAAAGVIVMAVELYLVFLFIELLFSAWYRSEAFTDA